MEVYLCVGLCLLVYRATSTSWFNANVLIGTSLVFESSNAESSTNQISTMDLGNARYTYLPETKLDWENWARARDATNLHTLERLVEVPYTVFLSMEQITIGARRDPRYT